MLREAVKALIPTASYHHLKRPFLAPPLGGARPGRFTDLLQDTLRSSAIKSSRFLDTDAIESLLDRLPQMNVDELTLWSPVLTIALSITLMCDFSASGYSMESFVRTDAGCRPKEKDITK